MPGVDLSELRAWEVCLPPTPAGVTHRLLTSWVRKRHSLDAGQTVRQFKRVPLTEFSSITESLTQYVNKVVLQERKLDCSGKQQHVKYLEGRKRFEVQKIKGKIATVPPGASARA